MPSHCQVGSLPVAPPGKPVNNVSKTKNYMDKRHNSLEILTIKSVKHIRYEKYKYPT